MGAHTDRGCCIAAQFAHELIRLAGVARTAMPLRLTVARSSALPSIARVEAMPRGHLDATPLDIVLLRGRIAFDTVGWEEVRDAFAGWLRPAGVPLKPSPRKRPR